MDMKEIGQRVATLCCQCCRPTKQTTVSLKLSYKFSFDCEENRNPLVIPRSTKHTFIKIYHLTVKKIEINLLFLDSSLIKIETFNVVVFTAIKRLPCTYN